MVSAGGQAQRVRPTRFKPVGALVPKLVREACRRRGFVNIDIVLRWREIVGEALARETWPVRIDWPRRQEAVLRPDGTEAPGAHRTRLVVGATPARALDVEYAKRAIIDRLNGYLGYRAATELAAAPDYSVAPEGPRRPAAGVAAAGPEVAADPLSAALERLGRAVAAQRRR
jgi:hypothetical protein